MGPHGAGQKIDLLNADIYGTNQDVENELNLRSNGTLVLDGGAGAAKTGRESTHNYDGIPVIRVNNEE